MEETQHGGRQVRGGLLDLRLMMEAFGGTDLPGAAASAADMTDFFQ
jgi:hypothetical protein